MNRLPIRLRIALLVGAVAGLVAVGIGGLTLSRSNQAIAADFDTSLGEEAAEAYLAVLGGLPLDTFRHPGSIYGIQRVGVFDSAGQLVDHTLPNPPPAPSGQLSGDYYTVVDPILNEELRLVNVPVDYQGSPHTLVVAVPTIVLDVRGDALVRTVALAAIAFTLLASIGAYLVTALVLRPIEMLRREAMDLAESPDGRRLTVPEPNDEVRELASSFNDVLAHIEEVMDGQRRFLAEASHELRTPIARLRADIDLARRPIRTQDELIDSLGRIDDHAQHLTSLADSLLAMLTADKGTKLAAAVGVGAVIEGLRDRSANGEMIHISMSEASQHLTIAVDQNLLVSVLCNLVDNAFRHGEPPVEVTVREVDEIVEFAVRDHGLGISQEYRAEVVKPFGRGVAPTSGTGLGLSVVTTFASTTGGQLIIEDADPGCRMILQLPTCSAIAQSDLAPAPRTGVHGNSF